MLPSLLYSLFILADTAFASTIITATSDATDPNDVDEMVADIIPAFVQGNNNDYTPDCCNNGCVAPKACTSSGYSYAKCGGKCVQPCAPDAFMCQSSWSGEAFCACPTGKRCTAVGCE
jgi:hypothetical protein